MNFYKKVSQASGFTLIELLVVIAIIALLTGIILTNLTASKAKSRDAERASDLAQIQLAIEQYFDRCDEYPVNINDINQSGGCPSGVNLSDFISKIPTDPSTGQSYGYVVNSPSDPTDYVLYSTFETTNSALSQTAPNPSWYPSGSSDYTCTANLDYCVRPN